MSGLDSRKPTACCCCCLPVKLVVCADSALLMSLWTDSWNRYCCADMLTALAPLDLELEFTSMWELLRDTLTAGQGWFTPSRPTLSFHCSSSLCVLWLSRCHWTGVALLFHSSSFLNILGLASYFSCFVKRFCFVRYLCECKIVSFCFFSWVSPFSSEHRCVAGFTVCSGFKRGFALVISSSLLSVSCLIISYSFLYPKKQQKGFISISFACGKPSVST